MLCLGGAIIGLMNQLSQSLMSVAIGALTSILVLAPLVGIQLASQVAVQVVLSMLAGAVVIGAMSVARGAPFLPSEERRLFVFPNRLQPMVPFQLMFMGVPLLIVSLLADSPASLVSAALLGALLVTIPWPSRTKSWQVGASPHRRYSPVGPNIQGAHTQAPHGRFEKFSEGARSVLSHAQEEAQWFNHNYIGTEYILLGLVREPEGVAAKVLTNLGVELSKVRSAVEFIIGSGERPGPGDIGLTPRAKKVIELAVDEARRLSHHYIGTEHLLIGIMREGEGVAAGVLESMGVNLERVRADVARLSQNSE